MAARRFPHFCVKKLEKEFGKVYEQLVCLMSMIRKEHLENYDGSVSYAEVVEKLLQDNIVEMIELQNIEGMHHAISTVVPEQC